MAREQQQSQELLQTHLIAAWWFPEAGLWLLWVKFMLCVERTNKADSAVRVNNAEAFARPVAQEWFPRPPGNTEWISFEDPLQHYCGKAGKILKSRKDFWSLVGHLATSYLKLRFARAAVGVNMQHLFGGALGSHLHPSAAAPPLIPAGSSQAVLCLPVLPPAHPQAWDWHKAQFGLTVDLLSLHHLLLCAGQGLTSSLVKPWFKKQCLSRLRWD